MPEETSTTQVTEVKTQSNQPPVVTEPAQKVYTKKKAIFRIYQVIWYLVGVIETLLIFRLILKMLGANPNSGFTNLVYTLSDPFALPFRGIFQTQFVEGSVFEWSTIVAGIVYFILAYGIVQLFQMAKPTTPQEVEEKVNNT